MNSNRRLPNLLIVGAQKAGTTALHTTLARHNGVFMSEVKEINFFTYQYDLGIDAYSKHFNSAEPRHRILGESSPGYMCVPGVPERIRQCIPNVKIIMLVRDPISRALSQYWHSRRNFGEELSFSEAIQKYRIEEFSPGKKGYFVRGRYIDYIERYLQHFSRDQIHVIIFEELVSMPQIEFPRLFEFLKLSPSGIDCLDK